ncbi:MAG: DUF309 domain-containing protein [Nitrospiraceae bacterium]
MNQSISPVGYAIRPSFSPVSLPSRTNPHPKRHRKGHSFGHPEPTAEAFQPDDWAGSETYLFAVDLFNFGYWWESHEQWESLWHALGKDTEQGSFVRALIQLAAAHVKRETGFPAATLRLIDRALGRFQSAPPHYMGIDVAPLILAISEAFHGERPSPSAFR